MTSLRFAIIGIAAIFIGIALAEATAPAFFGTMDEYKGPTYKVGVPIDHMVDEEGKSFVTIETSNQKTYTGELAISEALSDEVVIVINTNPHAIKETHDLHSRLYIVGLVTVVLGLTILLYSLFRKDIKSFFTKEKKDAQ